MPRVDAVEIVEDFTASSRCDEGFLHVRRYRARNRRVDGTLSPTYRIDVLDRPSLDAVAVCLWARTPHGVEVLLRRQLRPAVLFRRGKARALPEPEPLLYEEIVAGLLEPGERGVEALRQRGAEEAREEAGVDVAPERLDPLGAAFYTLPGIVSEKIHLFAAEVDRGNAQGDHEAPADGDGSPLEEGATLVWRGLDDAIAACASGEIEDAKSELAFRRLRDRIAGAPAGGR
ncbi:MAG TPA: NUDIX hydrolase [Anaeromyxobacteraceae bacterium]|nr:NUDIX hydrolase [Anaeromyxobacteraceae bacterium]